MIQKGSLSLNTIETLVLDEADRMLDMGFKPDIDKILEYMGRKGEFQIALFSATIPDWVKDISQNLLQEFKFFNLAKNLENKSAKNIEHICIKTKSNQFSNCLKSVIEDYLPEENQTSKCIIFTQTKA